MPGVIDAFLLSIKPPSFVVVTAGLVLVFILPGYAYLAALFPNRPGGTSAIAPARGRSIEPLTLTERLALSFGLSLGLLSILGIIIEVSTWHYSAMVGGGFLLLNVILGTLIGTARGHVSPFDRRPDRFRRARRYVTGEGKSAIERLVAIGLALTILLAFASLSVAVLVPQTGESYTGLTLLTSGDEEGPITGAYPETLVQNEPTEFVVLVQNRERSAMSYTLVVTEQRMRSSGEEAAVAREWELSRQTVEVADGENERFRLEVVPTMAGTDLRIAFYLYRGTAPAEVNEESAYRQLYVWVDVQKAPSNS